MYSQSFLKFSFLDIFFNKILENNILNYFNFSNKKVFKYLDYTQSYKYFNQIVNIAPNSVTNDLHSFNSKL